jgi:hypothetical protein
MSCPAACNAPCSNVRQLFDHKPERLVISGFRCCMAAYEFGDPACWETVWRDLIEETGADTARSLMGELQYWVRAIRANSSRDLQLFPYGCRHICADECLALSLVATLQHGSNSTAAVAAAHLLGRSSKHEVGEACKAGTSFGRALEAHGLILQKVSPWVIDFIAAKAAAEPSRRIQ